MNKKAILLPIQPKWCELIAADKKKYELRKNAPKCDFPITIYIYQSKHKWTYSIYDAIADLQGKVIGKFTLNETVYISGFDINWMGRGMSAVPGVYALVHSCVPQEDVRKYQGSSVYLFAWKIDDLVIFDKPLNLSDFGLSRAPQNYCFVEEIV